MGRNRRPYERVKMNVCNQSDRGGKKPLLVVLHDTESHDRPANADLEAIGAWFDNPVSQASAHVCVDGEGRSARYVLDARKAWHCAGYNSVSLGIEQIGFASYPKLVWKKNRKQLHKVARYVAFWSRKYNIPIRKGKVSGGQVLRPGVVTHMQLGVVGGGHDDPGRSYPFWLVLRLARRYAKS